MSATWVKGSSTEPLACPLDFDIVEKGGIGLVD